MWTKGTLFDCELFWMQDNGILIVLLLSVQGVVHMRCPMSWVKGFKAFWESREKLLLNESLSDP